uniref:Leucine rich repeat containing 66 n=1 Tax=Anser brachyrhynchus TaxID=132585 RepID=A0A8B9B8V8_9AVES
MDNLHLSVVAVVLYFNIPGSVGTKSQQLLNAHHHSDCRWDGKFSVNCSFTGLSAIPEDISQTSITADLSYNNITTLLCANGRSEDWMLKHLNLSNNLISELSVTAFRNLPVLETLNLNGNSINTLTLDIPTAACASETYGKVHHFLPALKVLSAERNHLDAVPRGLLQSLQSVRLSFNGILRIDLNDFQNCSQLKTIYLRNNKITTIHPDAFQGLNNLQVVDLRENALKTILPQIIIHLNIFQLEVDLSSNSWIFNCRLNAFKHLIPFLSDSMRKKMSTSHSKSASNSQKPVLYLSSFHLNCSEGILFKTAAIPAGQTSVLRCDTDNTGGTQERTKQDFTLAICLSVFITFFCAFCLGVFARPYLVRLWMCMRRNKSTGSEHTYSNEAFSDETLSRERYVRKPPNRQQNPSAIYENSSKRARTVPTDTDHLYTILSRNCMKDTKTENLSDYRKTENSPHAQYNRTIEGTNERGHLADFFGDSSSDEGTAFTMSDGSSLEDFDLEQPGASSSLPAPQPSLEKAATDNGSIYCSALPEHPNIAAELQHAGKNEDKHTVNLENATDGVRYYQLLHHYYGSDTTKPQAASPDTDKHSDRVNMSDSDSVGSSQRVSETCDYFTNEESTVQNSILDSPRKHDTDLSNTLLSLKPFPMYARDTENTPGDADLQLQFPIGAKYFLRSSPTERKEHAPEVSTEELTDGSSSESDRDEGDVTLRQNSSTSENNYFTSTPIDIGLNETVKKAAVLRASISSNESPLQSPMEDKTEEPFKFITEKEDSLPQGEHVNTTKTWEDKMQRRFNEEEYDEHIELQDSTNCSSPEEMQPRSVMAGLVHIESSGKIEPVFNTGKYFQLDPSEENPYSLSVPSSFFNGSLQHSSFPQKSPGDRNSRNTDSNEKEDGTTLTGLKNNYTTAVSLPHSSEKLIPKSQTRQGQFFAKKKRAFDGFAVMLQSRTECSSSDTEV